MPRYYFNLRDGDELIPDDEGIELPAIENARKEAIRGLADCARDAIYDLSRGDLVIEVVDSLRNLLFVTRLTFATEFHENGDVIVADKHTEESSVRDPIRQSDQTNWIKHRNLAP